MHHRCLHLAWIGLAALALGGGSVRAQGVDHASPVRARLENGVVTIREFSVPVAPFPGIPQNNSPLVEAGEHRLRFNARDVLAFHPDGKPVDSAVWQAALAQETSALFVGYALVDPNAGAPAARATVNLPADDRAAYKPDALVLFGARSPVTQEPVANAKPLKGVAPRFGTAVVQADGMIRVTERREVRSHFYAPVAGRGNTHIFQNTTISTTRSLPFADVRVWTPDGRQIPSATLPQWLKEEYAALISGDGGEVDPLFLGLLKPNTPVIAVPTPPPPADGLGPRPAAPPPAPK